MPRDNITQTGLEHKHAGLKAQKSLFFEALFLSLASVWLYKPYTEYLIIKQDYMTMKQNCLTKILFLQITTVEPYIWNSYCKEAV